MHRLIFGLVSLAAITVGLLVGTLNSDQVRLDLLWVQLEWPLGLLLLLSLAVGLLLGMVMIYFSRVLPLRLKLREALAETVRAESRNVTGVDD